MCFNSTNQRVEEQIELIIIVKMQQFIFLQVLGTQSGK